MRILLGGVASTPVRIRKAEDLLRGRGIDAHLIKEAAVAASEAIEPIHDVWASAEYRREMIEVFVERGIEKAIERAKGGRL